MNDGEQFVLPAHCSLKSKHPRSKDSLLLIDSIQARTKWQCCCCVGLLRKWSFVETLKAGSTVTSGEMGTEIRGRVWLKRLHAVPLALLIFAENVLRNGGLGSVSFLVHVKNGMHFILFLTVGIKGTVSTESTPRIV